MNGLAARNSRRDLVASLSSIAAGSVLLLFLDAYAPSGFLILVPFLIAPILLVFTVASIYLVVRGRRSRTQLISPAVLWVVVASLFIYEGGHPFAFSETVKWIAASNKYKNEVLAFRAANGDLKYIEWDADGFAGVANNTAYLVFDPSDALSGLPDGYEPPKFGGALCGVRSICQLEKHWYAVLFYTDQYWGYCEGRH